ncbi:SPARC-like protein 1 [Anomaloglossus baeobatrachus]|uniref:SPARC-like protein 1 n=1 Tax=Anomaloglossus baeobatrachus TaxID=238106 RepID=UPI003F507BF7
MDTSTESIIDSKLSGKADDSKTKAGIFSLESFLNLFSEGNDRLSPLDGKYNQTNISESKKEGYSVNGTDEMDIQAQKEHISQSQESENNDQELSSDELSEQYGSSPIEHKNKNVKPTTESNTGYSNILEGIYNDEELRYILNISHNLDTMIQNINNDTDKLYVEEPSSEDAIDIKDLETVTNKKEDVKDDDVETSRDDNLVKEENGVKTRIIFSDHVRKQKESDAGEQQNQHLENIGNSNRVKDVDSAKMFGTDQNDENTDKVATALPTYNKNSGELHDFNVSIQKEEGSLELSNMNLSADQCIHFHCKRGKICKTDGHGKPFCVCEDPVNCLPGNRNDFVCGTDNKTYTSTCHLFGTKCHLEGTKERSHLHLDYQGPCKYIPPCTEYELTHFPFRMRDWLKNVLMQLYERDNENTGLLSEKQKSKVKKIYDDEKRLQDGDHNIELLVKDFQKNYNMYIYPVHWQFHQLDRHLVDRLLTHSELAALRAPLIPIEHCVNAFLQECNSNKDRHISLWEWCRCFGIKEGDINEDLLF